MIVQNQYDKSERLTVHKKTKKLKCILCGEEKDKKEFAVLNKGRFPEFFSYACRDCERDNKYEQDKMEARKGWRAANQRCCDDCVHLRPLTKKCRLHLQPRFGKCPEKDEFLYYSQTIDSGAI